MHSRLTEYETVTAVDTFIAGYNCIPFMKPDYSLRCITLYSAALPVGVYRLSKTLRSAAAVRTVPAPIIVLHHAPHSPPSG